MGVEPTSSAWEADILPMNYARTVTFFIIYLFAREFNIIISRNAKERVELQLM